MPATELLQNDQSRLHNAHKWYIICISTKGLEEKKEQSRIQIQYYKANENHLYANTHMRTLQQLK